MRQLAHGNSAETLRIEIPSEWEFESLTGIDLSIYDRSAEKLLDSEAMTLWTPTTLDAAAARYSDTITLDAGADDLEKNDMIIIVGAAGQEVKKVKGFDSTFKTVTLSTVLKNQYSNGDAVYATHATIDLDLSDTDVYTDGLEVTLEFVPAGTGAPFTIEANVTGYKQVYIAGFTPLFEEIYPRAYDGLTNPVDRLSGVLGESKKQLRKDLLSDNPKFNIDYMRDQEVLTTALMLQCAMNWTMNGDKELADERKKYEEAYDNELKTLKKLNIWLDSDGNLIQEETETAEHGNLHLPVW